MLWLNRNKFFNKYLPIILSVILVATAIGGYYIYKAAQPAKSAWFNTVAGNWGYRQRLVINHTLVSTASSTTLSNFPVFITVTNAALESVANGGHVSSGTGNDFVFTGADGLSKLPHEIISYASTTGQLTAWVKVTAISATTDTTIYMYYGGPTTNDQSNKTAVWDSNFKLVEHLSDAGNANLLDSTANANTATTTNITATTTAPTGIGAVFDGSTSNINAGSASSLDDIQAQGGGGMTIDFWINSASTSNKTIMGKGTQGNLTGFWALTRLSVTTPARIGFTKEGGPDTPVTWNSVLAVNTWTHLALVWDGFMLNSDFRLYKNGALMARGSITDGAAPNSDAANNLMIGSANGAGGFFDGALADVHISNIQRSQDWIITEYNNQNSPSTFITFYQEETPPNNQINGKWYNASWGYRKKIIINHQQVSGTSTLANFPVLVNITSDSLLKTTTNGGHVASSTGADILFTGVDGVTKLNYEREIYASTTGQLIAWVNVPILSNAVDTVLYMYYGNSTGGLADQQNVAATWNTNYTGVWHMANGTTLSATDSTGNDNGTITTPVATSGQIDGGALYNGTSDYVEVHAANASMPNALKFGTTPFMVSFWFNGANSAAWNGGYLVGGNRVSGWNVQRNSSGVVRFNTVDGVGCNDTITATANIYTSTWHYVVGYRDGTSVNMYIDGVAQTPITDHACNTDASASIQAIRFGSTGTAAPGSYHGGSVDEYRFSNIARSADWVKTEYNNQSAPSTFVTNGSEETQTKTSFNASWFSSDWAFRKPIVIDKNQISQINGTTLTNFPVLINTTDSGLQANASSTGADILFTSGDGLTKLNHQIESYSSTTGQLTAWVQVPTMSPTADVVLYMYYGNANALSQQNASAVWDANYTGVWHFNEGTASSTFDSTSDGFTGTAAVGATWVAGFFPGTNALNFSGGVSVSVDVGSHSALDNYNQLTYSGWIKSTANGSTAAFMGKTANKFFGITSASVNGAEYGGITSFSGTTAVAQSSSSVVKNNVWYYATMTFDSTSKVVTLYLNGLPVATATGSGTYTNTDSGSDLLIGSGTIGSWRGPISEARVSNSVRTPDWINTEYRNQGLTSTFVSVGGAQTQNRTAAAVAINSRGAGNWYDPAWTNRRLISIVDSKLSTVATSTFSNFPMLFASTDNEFKTTGNGGKVASSTGADILFTLADGVTKINYEMETYASTTGAVIAWVKIPLLTRGTSIYIYYGNSTPGLADQQNAAATWDTFYAGVWHLPNGTTLTSPTPDSTTNGNVGTIHGTATAATGQIGGAQNFNGTTNWDSLATTTSLNINNTPVTMSTWVKTSNGPIIFGGYNPVSPFQGYGFRINAGTYQYWAGSAWVASNSSVNDGNWHYIVVTSDNTTARFYKDGVADGTQGTGKPQSYSGQRAIGAVADGSAGQSASVLDEVRVSAGIFRSADWIKTEYNNQFSPSTFYTIAGLNPQVRSAALPLLKSRGGVKFH